jgi:MerR family transcriptional regulator, copper efflux regulator
MNDPAGTTEAAAQAAPIACTLDAGALDERVEEWRSLVASSVVAVESDASCVRLLLRDSDAALLAAVSLGAREKACCAFFDVAVEIQPESRVLRLSVPEGAEEALASFAELLRS